MRSFSVASSSISEVVKALRLFFEEIVPSDFASFEIDADKPHKWQVTGMVFVEYVPVQVEVCAKTCNGEVGVSVNHTSHSDIIRFSSLFRQMIAFLQRRGLQASSNAEAFSIQPQLLDDEDDFDFSDDEEPSWEEKVEQMMQGTNSIRTEVRAEAFRAMAQWASSNPESHEGLAWAFINRADKLSSLFYVSSQASVAETYPFAVALRKLSEGCSAETRNNLLKSSLSNMRELASEPGVQVVAREYAMAMQALGKNVSNAIDDFAEPLDIIDNKHHVKQKQVMQLERSEGSYQIS